MNLKIVQQTFYTTDISSSVFPLKEIDFLHCKPNVFLTNNTDVLSIHPTIFFWTSPSNNLTLACWKDVWISSDDPTHVCRIYLSDDGHYHVWISLDRLTTSFQVILSVDGLHCRNVNEVGTLVR